MLSDGPIRSPQQELAEVEHALSVLDGRHPDFAKAEREKAQAMARRRRQLDQAEAEARRTRRRRLAASLITITVVGTVGWTTQSLYEGRKAKLASSARLARTFEPLGLRETPPEPWALWRKANHLEVPVAAGVCVVALGTDGAGVPTSIELSHDGDSLEALGSVGLCTCVPDTVVVKAKTETGSVRLLQGDAKRFGSVLGFARGGARPATVLDSACKEEHIDAWLTMERDAPANEKKLGAAWQSDPRAAELASSGVRHDARASSTAELFPLRVGAGECVLAIPEGPADTVALRLPGGNRPLSSSKVPVGACSKAERTYGVSHEGAGAVHVLRASALRVGGRHELTRIAARAKTSARVWLDAADATWDAELSLRAARVFPIHTTDWKAGKLPDDARTFVVSLGGEGSASPGAPALSDTLACDAAGEPARTAACTHAGRPNFLEARGRADGAVAYGGLPTWLKPFAEVPGKEASTAAAQVVALTRRLVALGFEPVPLEGITETPSGADVLGRAKENGIVAFAAQRSAPYAVPLTDGPAWTLDGAPRVIDLEPGRRAILRARTALDADHRTLVFRRAESSKAL